MTFSNSLDQDQAQQKGSPDPDTICLTLEEVDFEKKNQQTTKSMKISQGVNE